MAKVAEKKPAAAIPPPPAPEMDLLSGFDAPSQANEPPPQYDTNFLPPPPAEAPPPSFDPMMQFAPPPPLNNSVMAPPPPAENNMYIMAPPQPEASAPAFEDLQIPQEEPNLLDGMPSAMPPPPDIDEDILAALDPAERAAILEEQRKIMEDIEKAKQNESASSAAARAMAFDQRSSAAVAKVAGQFDSAPPRTSSTRKSTPKPPPPPAQISGGMVDLGAGQTAPLHGQEKTQAAIKDGTAMIVQCLNCQNWMQVTKDATLMFCPTCQVVSPVLADEAATDADLQAAAQLSADAQLAEKLQAEEYGAMEKARAKAAATKKTPKMEKGQAVEQSWMDWFMGAPAEETSSSTKPPPPARGSAELPSSSRGLVAASTGEEAYGRSGMGGGARMAESKGMFACVADAVGTAVYAMNQDDEGNVHGVDSAGLLAMPNVSRQRD